MTPVNRDSCQEKFCKVSHMDIMTRLKRFEKWDTSQYSHGSELILYGMNRRHFPTCQKELRSIAHVSQRILCSVTRVTGGSIQCDACPMKILGSTTNNDLHACDGKRLDRVRRVIGKWLQFGRDQRKFRTGWHV